MARLVGGIGFTDQGETWELETGLLPGVTGAGGHPQPAFEGHLALAAGATLLGIADPATGDVTATASGRLASERAAQAHILIYAPRRAFEKRRRDPRRRSKWIITNVWSTRDVVGDVPVNVAGEGFGTAIGTVAPPVPYNATASPATGDTTATVRGGAIYLGTTAANSTGGSTATATGNVIFAAVAVLAQGEGFTRPAQSVGGTPTVLLDSKTTGLVAIAVRGGHS